MHSIKQASEHELNHGHIDHRFALGGSLFVVSGEPSEVIKPRESPLDDPSFGFECKIQRSTGDAIEYIERGLELWLLQVLASGL